MIIHNVIQGSPEWRRARLGVPTASCFDKICTPKGDLSKSSSKYMAQLVAEWATGMPLDDAGSAFMDRGTALEDEAIAAYEFQTGNTVERVGFIALDDGSAGCSPDGLIQGQDIGLEVKCKELVNHVAAAIDPDNAHFVQCQGGLWITGRKVWHRWYFNPVLPPVLAVIERDEGFILRLNIAVTEFCDKLAATKERLLAEGWKPPEPLKKCPHTGYPIGDCDCGVCESPDAEDCF